MKKALEEIKVADFTTSGTGELTCKYLAEHGAEVVWVESRVHPDVTRVTAPYRDGIVGVNRTGLVNTFCGSKYSMALNLRHKRGVEVARRLVAWSDVVVTSFAPGVIERLGLGYEELKKVKSDIVMLSISIQGQTGPRSQAPGWGIGIKGLGGLVHFTGWPDRAGVGTPLAYADTTTPWLAVAAIMAALDYRRRTGKGQYIDFAQFEASLQFIPPVALLDYTVNHRIDLREGNRAANAVPHGVYRCRGDDRWCATAVRSDEEWAAFCQIMGNPGWAKEERFSTFLDRKRNEDELERLVEGLTLNWSAEELMQRLQAKEVPAGVVQNCEDLLDKDPQIKHRQFYRLLERPEAGPCIHTAWPPKLSKTPCELSPAPDMGQHTEYVCHEILGMSDEEFVELLSEGVLE